MNFIKKALIKTFNLQGTSAPSGIPASFPWQHWQMDMNPSEVQNNTSVEACVATIAQTVAMLPVKHYRTTDTGGTEIVTNSAANRVLRKPNQYQTRSDFFLNFTRNLLLTGNGYALASRNQRFEIAALHLQSNVQPRISSDKIDIYYDISGNGLDGLVDISEMVPSRDVLHTRLHTPRHPLIGETPLVAAVLSASLGDSIQKHENSFFKNMSRPSGTLESDLTLTAEQTAELRKRFNEHSKYDDSGGLPILTHGLKFKPLTMNAVDAQIVETYKMTIADVARVFRVPLTLINALDNASYNNVEQLMKFWISSGLGFILDHIELSLADMFGLPAGEFINFDTDYLLRSDFKSRMDGLSKGVQGGIYTPNEARAKEGLEPKEFGDDIYLQAQMVKVGTSNVGMDSEEPPAPNNPGTTDLPDDEKELPLSVAKHVLKGFLHE